MPRFFLITIFLAFFGAVSPSGAAVYPNGKIFLFSGLAHTAFKRLDVPFPGWVQPDFRSLTRKRNDFVAFVNEIRGYLLSNRSKRAAVRRDSLFSGTGRTVSTGIDANTILPIQLGGRTTVGNTIDVFAGVNLRNILTQIFSTVFSFTEEFSVDDREQESRLLGGAVFNSEANDSGSSGRSYSGLFYRGAGGWMTSQRTVTIGSERRQLLPAPGPMEDESKFLFRVWRKRIASAMTNPVVIFGIVVAGLLSFAWRVQRTGT